LESINSLLKNGCRRSQANVYGKTPIQRAKELEAPHIAEFIDKYPEMPRRYPKFEVKLDIEKLIDSPISKFINNYKMFNNTFIRDPFNNFKGKYRIKMSDTKTVKEIVEER
jgi:hypothetical protein